MEDTKNKVEAILFTTGKFLSIEDISSLIGVSSLDQIKDALNSLIQDYNSKNSSLQITQQGNQYKLTLKKDYLYLNAGQYIL